jgi:uncharacterized protein YjbJ (UPF0337 family)
MTNDSDKAAQAREGMFDSIAGKAKEVAGAVTGKDELVEEGQLQQAEARTRKEALAADAVADVKRAEAAGEMREASQEAAQLEGAARDRAAREEAVAEQQRASAHAAAADAAVRQEAAGREAAEREADAVAERRLREAEALEADAESTEQQTTEKAARLQREAVAAANEAAQLRAQTES